MRRTRIETLGSGKHNENFVLLSKGIDGVADCSQVVLILAISIRAGIMEVRPTVVAMFVSTRGFESDQLCYGCLHRPLKWINGAHHQHRRAAVPAEIFEN